MRLSVLLITLLLILTCTVQAVEFHVAPSGSDANAGNATRPFATLQRARDAVRTWKQAGKRAEAITVTVHKGTYHLTAPVVFEPQDSGSAQFPVTYRALPGEKVVISGGVPITNWRKQDAHIWVAVVPWAKQLADPFTQLFVNGIRRPRARTPNEGAYAYTRRLQMKDVGSESQVCTGLTFEKGDLKPWDSSEDALICLFHNWVNSYDRAGKVDWSRQQIEFTRDAGIFFLGPHVRYYVENVRSALDAPGEWYLDRNAGLLLYYPMPGEVMAKAEVITPVVKQTLMQINGLPDNGQYVEYMQFKGMSFQHTDADLSPNYQHSVQGANTQRGAIFATGMRNCLIENCEFTRLGEHCISLREGCVSNIIQKCHMHDMGGGGVYLSEDSSKTSDWALTTHNVVDNNFIHDGGYIFRAGCGVFLGGSASYNQIIHNEICDMNWMGVHMGWSWTGKSPAATNHNEVGWNHIHHIGNGVLNDIGGIYTLGVSSGTVLHHNLIHDVSRFERGSEGYGGWGIYLDAGSSEIRVEDNIVYNTRDGGFHAHCDGYPHDDTIVNNIFAYAEEGQMIRNNYKQPDGIHLTLERNIIYNKGKALFGGSSWKPDAKVTMDKNIYWSEQTPTPEFFGNTFAQWQKLGRDVNGIVANPRFVNAKDYDFRLLPDSPAIKLGFKPLDLRTAGLTGSAEWRKLPLTIKHRQTERAKAVTISDISLDFEDYAAGATPDGGIARDKETSVVITDKDAATGNNSMLFTDGAASATWKPHWFVTRTPSPGKRTIQFSVKNDAEKPGTIDIETRDWPQLQTQYQSGPHIVFGTDGMFTALTSTGSVVIGKAPLGKWIKAHMEFNEGEKAAKTFSILLTGPGGLLVEKKDIPFHSTQFNQFNWFGISGAGTTEAHFYADDITIK